MTCPDWIRRGARMVAAAACALLPPCALAADTLGASALRARHLALAPQLADSPFGAPLLLQSGEAGRRLQGDAWAVIERPFAQVSPALAESGHWCDILILHLNTKDCRRTDQGGSTRVDLRVGRKEPQPAAAAAPLSFRWRPAVARGDYLAVGMDAAEGPYGTGDYTLTVEAVPLDAGRTFLHVNYGFSYGGASALAMRLYLGTMGHDKVGFSRDRAGGGAGDGLVGGMRGVAERNTMRYWLAIQAYLAAPGERQLEQRLAAWFDATERHARQLHEVERDDYLRMKREEARRSDGAR